MFRFHFRRTKCNPTLVSGDFYSLTSQPKRIVSSHLTWRISHKIVKSKKWGESLHRTTFTLCSVSCLCQYQRLRKCHRYRAHTAFPSYSRHPTWHSTKGPPHPEFVARPKAPAAIFFFLSVLMLCAHVFIFTSGSPALLGCHIVVYGFVDTYHIQYTFLSLCQLFFSRENGQNTKILEVRHFRMMTADGLLGAQSIKIDICCCCCCCVSFFLLKNNPTVNLTVCLGD